jgi:prepilin-type processing-associated H-X9-DG protein
MHLDTNGHFPHGTYNYIDSTGRTGQPYGTHDGIREGRGPHRQDRRCWMHDLLPFFEQTAHYDLFTQHMDTGASALAFLQMDTVIPTAMCTSDPLSPKLHTFWGGLLGDRTPTQGFSGNYVANASSTYFNRLTSEYRNTHQASADTDGVFFALSEVSMEDISDGSSNTLMLSELILVEDTDSHDIRGRYHNPAHGGVLFSTLNPPNTSQPDVFNWCAHNPPLQAPCLQSNRNMQVAARSYHPGMVNVCRADGSVSAVQDGIDLVVYSAMGSRNGEDLATGAK